MTQFPWNTLPLYNRSNSSSYAEKITQIPNLVSNKRSRFPECLCHTENPPRSNSLFVWILTRLGGVSIKKEKKNQMWLIESKIFDLERRQAFKEGTTEKVNLKKMTMVEEKRLMEENKLSSSKIHQKNNSWLKYSITYSRARKWKLRPWSWGAHYTP